MILNKKNIIATIFLWMVAFSCFGQQVITGQIIDSKNRDPLIGVSIIDQQSSEGTITDIDGQYELTIAQIPTRIEISYIGYNSKTVDITSDNVDRYISTTIQSEAVQLDNVIITGIKPKRASREVGYSTDEIDGKEIALSNAPNVINALSGKSAGVNISSGNGVDGGTSRITIRGNNNIKGNNQPLIIVDGVPIENPPGLTGIGRGTDWGSAINNLNADDIAEVNILKGPTASAQYGTRGANGVVLITTKKGTQRKGVGVEYIVTHKFIQPYRYRSVQNKYGAGGPINLLEPTFRTNAAGELAYPRDVHSNNGPGGRPTTETFGFYSTGVSWGPEMLGQEVRWWDGELRNYSPQEDNLKQFFSAGNTTSHNLNFSTGSDNGTMRVSMTYQDHTAVVPNSNYNQYTFNIGSSLNISDKLISNIGLTYINYSRKNSPSLGDDNNASFGKGILYSWPRSYQGLEEELNILPDGSRYTYGGNYPFQFTPSNLWWNTQNQNTFLTRNKAIGSMGLTYSPTEWLSINGRIGLDFNLNEFERRYNPVNALGIEEALYGNEIDRNIVINNDLIITAQKEKIFNLPVNASLTVGGTQWSRDQYGLNATADRWENPWLFSFNNFSGANPNNLPLARELRYNKKINSIYSFLNLSYDNFLFLELSGRNDWSSSLPQSNNSYFYPSASLSYILSESIPLKIDWLNFVKLRASYARTASDTDPFLLDFVYDTGSFGGQQTASLPSTKPPVDLRPQQANSYEVGMTLGLFDDKLTFDLTYYYIKSFDQILESPSPSSSGASQVRINNGVLENYGYELSMKAYLWQNKNGFFNTGINLAQNRNFVQSLGDGAEFLEIGNIWGDFGPKIMVREGEEYGTIYGYDYIRHENGQPILNDAGTHYLITDELVPVGNASPTLTGGWTTTLRYKNFTINTLVDTKIGGDIYAGSHVIGLQTGQSPSTLVERDGGGLPYTDPEGNVRNIGVILPGVDANGVANDKVVHYYYKYLPNAGGWGKVLTTPGILDNTWAKMREMSISYQVPTEQIQKLKFFQDMRVSLVGRDLFYLYSSIPDRINPEGQTSSGNAQGLEWASFPSMRSVSLRVTSSF